MKKTQHFLTDTELRAKLSPEIAELKRRLKEKDQILENYKKEQGGLESFFRDVRETITPIEPLNNIYQVASSASAIAVDSPCHAVIHSSDGHMGAVQDANEIEGINAFNPDICKNRQIGFVLDFIKWISVKRKMYKIDNLTHIVTGDMISGDIHDELRVTNAFPTPIQVVEAGKLLAKQITMLSQCFINVTVEFIVEDNHGRLTKKPQAKEAGMNTHNYVVGEIAKAYVRGIKNVTFNIYPMNEVVVHAANRQYLICHGHNVRGWMGVPWYGVERKVGKESVARMQMIMEDISRAQKIGFHKYVFGHFHTPIDMDLYSCAGSVSGTDAFDHSAGRYSKPSQPGWIIHPKKGEFDRTNFKLRDEL